MTGVLYAKVGGQWVPVQMPAANTDEVWVGADDPGVGSQYEIWFDTDDDGPDFGNYAQGVTNLGAFNVGGGTLLPTTGRTVIATVQNFFYTSGRRYRLFIEINAITASAGTSSGWFDIGIDGVWQSGGVHHQATSTSPASHSNFQWEFFLEKYGMSAGLHTLQVGCTMTTGQFQVYSDLGTIEVRDVGPSNPMNPLTATTPAPWIPFPFNAGWQSYPGYQTCGYRRLGDMVFLRGLAQINTALGTPTAHVGVLPTGYRPPASILQPHSRGEPNSNGRLDIDNLGRVATDTTIANTNWASLNGVSFSVTPG